MQFGCAPKSDSTNTLRGEYIPTVLDSLRDNHSVRAQFFEMAMLNLVKRRLSSYGSGQYSDSRPISL
ncbi:hypothetical protein NYE33_20715 [Paenibacillus sp. FSL R10-2199]|uniref:hypothetical protein n=1 Tax=Paenibacillus sp. FSL R10-2199 TaxID=2975348 RepID=UPI0030F9024D